MNRYQIFNGAMPTTAAFVGVTTGTSIKTMLQVAPFNSCKILAWGISFNGSAAGTGIKVELLDTGTVFATVTASADADVMKLDSVTDQTAASVAGLTLGTGATGYTATAEGTITAVRLFDAQYVQPFGGYTFQFPLGDEPRLLAGRAGRIRVHAPAAVDAFCWMRLGF